MKSNRVIIAGGRDFIDWELFKMKVSYYLLPLPPEDVEIVSGGCRGADKMGERYAREYGYPCKIIGAHWGNFSTAAGPLRNKAMAEYSTHAIVFWDGASLGTKNMIKEAKAHGLKLRIVRY